MVVDEILDWLEDETLRNALIHYNDVLEEFTKSVKRILKTNK